jgi:transcriptional regulator with XRE-family HTH domain
MTISPIEQTSLSDDLHRKFGVRIRALRLGLSLSQEELAAECGLDRTYVGGIERGERNPSLKNISIIAKALRVPIAALFNESDGLNTPTGGTD